MTPCAVVIVHWHDSQTPHLQTGDTDHTSQPKLTVESDQRNLILHLDPQTWLISEARLEETLRESAEHIRLFRATGLRLKDDLNRLTEQWSFKRVYRKLSPRFRSFSSRSSD